MTPTPENTTIGFIGTGVMGHSMARHLLEAGYRVHLYTRTPKKAEKLLALGGKWQENIATLGSSCDIVFTMVGYPADVEEIYFGADGLLAHLSGGSYAVDMTTSRPDLARKIGREGAIRSLNILDAPVSGGDIGAREAKLSIMVGGPEEAFRSLLPLFKLFGTTIVHQGPHGCGQHTKMCNQIAIAAGMMGICEAMAYARKAGLSPENVLQSIESGAAGSWSLSNLAPRFLAGDYAPGFFVKHFIKDMKIAIEAAEDMQLELPGLLLAKKLYDKVAAQGCENDGTQSLFKLYSK